MNKQYHGSMNNDAYTDYGKPVSEMQATIARYEKALQWYADKRKWFTYYDADIDDYTTNAAEDGGERARKALEGGST